MTDTENKFLIETVHLGRALEYRGETTKGGVTIAFTVESTPMVSGTGLILHMALAVCQRDEHFIRCVGRNLSIHRLTEYLQTLEPTKNCSTIFIGLGSSDLQVAGIPFAYRNNAPFILGSQWDVLSLLKHEAFKIMATLHPEFY